MRTGATSTDLPQPSTAVEKASVPQTPEMLMMQIIDKSVVGGMGAEEIGHLKKMYDEMIAERAKVSFYDAMNQCQKEMPTVVKDAQNTFNKSRYARLETISSLIRPVYTSHGFSLSFGNEESKLEGHARVYADIMHSGGHVKRIHGDFPLDDVGSGGNKNKTGIQATGSTYSYARRYLTCLAFNVSIAEEDNDGVHGQATALVSPEQVRELNDLIMDCDKAGATVDMTAFLGLMEVKELKELKYLGFLEAKDLLRRKAAEGKKAVKK